MPCICVGYLVLMEPQNISGCFSCGVFKQNENRKKGRRVLFNAIAIPRGLLKCCCVSLLPLPGEG